MPQTQPRTDAGRYSEWEHGAPQVMLGQGFLNPDQLTSAEARKLDEHLTATTGDGTLTYAELYETLGVTHVAQEIVFTRRGAPPELVWRVHGLAGEPVIVPEFVAKASTVPDTSEPAIALKHRRDRARVAMEKATEERARRAGRVKREIYATLRQKEDLATERFLAAEATYAKAAHTNTDAAQSALDHWTSPMSRGFRESGYLTPTHVLS